MTSFSIWNIQQISVQACSILLFFPVLFFFNYYTILCLFLILILPTVHAVLWGFYIMLHRLGYHWGPTCYFTLSTWCDSTVQVSCTWILMKQWQFKPQEVKKKKKLAQDSCLILNMPCAWQINGYFFAPLHAGGMWISVFVDYACCYLGMRST